MTDLITKALTAKRESKHVEFKQSFDPISPGEWCELIKDIAAIANSGGGIVVFGLDNLGVPTGGSLDAVAKLDPAEIANIRCGALLGRLIIQGLDALKRGNHVLRP
jgi:predicted HTH transcriptional regulator